METEIERERDKRVQGRGKEKWKYAPPCKNTDRKKKYYFFLPNMGTKNTIKMKCHCVCDRFK